MESSLTSRLFCFEIPSVWILLWALSPKGIPETISDLLILNTSQQEHCSDSHTLSWESSGNVMTASLCKYINLWTLLPARVLMGHQNSGSVAWLLLRDLQKIETFSWLSYQTHFYAGWVQIFYKKWQEH